MELATVLLFALLAFCAVVALFAIVRALMDGQHWWAIGIAVCTPIGVGVVLAITYVTNVRHKLDL